MKNIVKKLAQLKNHSIALQKDTAGYNYKYATLDQIQYKLEEPIKELGLLITHQIIDNSLTTTIRDIESGDSLGSSIPLSTQKAQDKGSEITYYRRYNLLALLDLKTEDDDGRQAQESKPSFAPESTAWSKAIAKKAPIDTIKKHYTITKAHEKLYIETIK